MRISVPETADWPFGDKTQIDASELNAYLAGQGQTIFVPPAVETAPAWETNEKAFQERVRRFATEHGWRVFHTWDSSNSAPGFPDCVFAKDGQIYRVAELKVGGAKPAKDQLWWLSAFRAAGIPADVWTPEMWSEIEKILA